jgi:ubiquinone/menaquinone biosynthesis C-methylase UbiE
MTQSTPQTIRFTDGAAYERYMGVWSRTAGEAFLDWLKPAEGLRWLDVGCGNGAFTSLIFERCAPSGVEGIDPSADQIAYARSRFAAAASGFRVADAHSLPCEADTFDVAVMPLVIFFLKDPAKGLAEMKRTVRPGGLVAAYAWDMPGEGFPYAVMNRELKNMGVTVPQTPHPEISELGALRDLWKAGGLENVEAREILVQRTFADFEDYWTTVLGAPSAGAILGGFSDAQREQLRAALRRALPAPDQGSFTLSARAHAVAGRVS